VISALGRITRIDPRRHRAFRTESLALFRKNKRCQNRPRLGHDPLARMLIPSGAVVAWDIAQITIESLEILKP